MSKIDLQVQIFPFIILNKEIAESTCKARIPVLVFYSIFSTVTDSKSDFVILKDCMFADNYYFLPFIFIEILRMLKMDKCTEP